jgi:hypothetical protein
MTHTGATVAGTKKKTTKAKKSGWKQCSTKGCRRRRKSELYCDPCQAEADNANDPSNNVIRLTELERMQFVECDTLLHNQTLQIKNLDQEQRIEQTEFDVKKRARAHKVKGLRAAITQYTMEQRQLLAKWGEKYDFNPAHVSIDDKTGVVQEHKPDE